jgi:hypothetical protein
MSQLLLGFSNTIFKDVLGRAEYFSLFFFTAMKSTIFSQFAERKFSLF